MENSISILIRHRAGVEQSRRAVVLELTGGKESPETGEKVETGTLRVLIGRPETESLIASIQAALRALDQAN